jgi:endonuclease/exonuclease/phosphatase family metal-dependent hydrolase
MTGLPLQQSTLAKMSLLAVPFYHYVEENEWEQMHWYKNTPTHIMAPQNTIHAATFNVLCDLFKKLEPAICSSQRYEYHFSTLLPSINVDIIALQEVTSRYMEQLMSQPWLQERYPYSSSHAEHTNSQKIFTIILSKIPMKELYMFHADMSSADRPMPVAVFQHPNGKEFTFSTMHLKAGQDCHQVRKQQIDHIFQCFGTMMRTSKSFSKINQQKRSKEAKNNKKTWKEFENVVLMGDFNLHGDQEESYFPNSAIDVWKFLRPDEIGYTVDHELNRMVVKQAEAKGKVPHSNRYDRVYLLPQNQYGKKENVLFNATSVRLFGTYCLPDKEDVFPSDHFGIFTELNFNI